MTLGDYMYLWLDTYVVPFRAPSTASCYRRSIKSLPDDLTTCELDALDPLMIQCALNRQAVEHPRAAQLTYATLHVAMERAKKMHRVEYNPIDACEKPQHQAMRARVYDRDQLRAYLEAARRSDCWLLLLLISVCALRRGEALGLCRDDLMGGMLHIERQRMRIRGGYEARRLKSRASRRVIPLPECVMKEIMQAPDRYIGGWLVDSTPEHLYREHKRAISAARLPYVTLHGLRHSCATILAESGTPIKLLQAMLGHAHYALTADLYADHVRSVAYAPDVARICAMVV